MTEQYHPQTWAEKEALKDKVKISESSGEIIGVIVIGLITLFFYAHQTQSTGFFSPAFGETESALLYGALITGMAGPIARLLTGRRNKSRPVELMASAYSIVASAWLLAIFPFNFAHFGDIVPEFMRFLVTWVTNDIAYVLLAIGMAGGAVFVAVTSVLYFKVKKLLQSGWVC